MKKGKIYISGPMTGIPQLNFPAFYAAEERLKAAGWEVVNPARINTPGTPYDACMIIDLKALLSCAAIYVMEGWCNSDGATVELSVAIVCGMDVLYQRSEE